MKFIGLDLGWVSGASGLCCLNLQAQTLTLQSLDRQTDLSDILAWIDHHLPPTQPGLIAIDAPTQITNATGMRNCDKQAHRLFGKYHAGCYPANLNSGFADRLITFSHTLEQRGFAPAPAIAPQYPGRYQIETYPHAAMINLFQLPRILKYKKGKLSDRRPELDRLRRLILTALPDLEPTLQIMDLPVVPTTGAALKDLEDRLDSIICAYTAAHWWYWGIDRNLVLAGPPISISTSPAEAAALSQTITAGFIVVPAPPGSPVQSC